jgi:formate dehydrogenase major subunit
VNRRIIYNRASCDSSGQPYDPNRFVVRWTGPETKWDTVNGADVPDGGWPPEDKYAFIMKSDGHGHIFGPGLRDGPFPEHYEPWESVVDNPFSSQQHNPVFWLPQEDSPSFTAGERSEFPLIGTTYRVSEHWQSGAMTRNLPWLVEMIPARCGGCGGAGNQALQALSCDG